MFFEDLSPYSFGLPRSVPYVLNVGWLASPHPFPTGETPGGFVEQLRRCVGGFSVNKMRGFHSCEFCTDRTARPSFLFKSEIVWLGASEVWVPALDGRVFAAPDLIVHYVEEHHYCPPPAFIAAVKAASARTDWDPEQAFEKYTLAAFE